MSEYTQEEARERLDDAARASERTVAASRWFPLCLLFLGFWAFGLILLSEVVAPSGLQRAIVSAAWWLPIFGLLWWVESRDVRPKGAGRRLTIATALWFGAYLFVLGPLVRWQADDSLLWWALASAVMASPFFFFAWRAWRRP
jgi:hypothetical protein